MRNSQMWKRIRWENWSLPEMNDAREKRVEQLAFMLMMHTKNRAIQMITRLSGPVNGLEIWRRFPEEWEPVNRGRYRAMLMQFLQCPLTGSRGQVMEECERPVQQYEAQNVDTLRTHSKQQCWRTTHKIQSGADASD